MQFRQIPMILFLVSHIIVLFLGDTTSSSNKKTRIHFELSKAIYQCMVKAKEWPAIDLFRI
jgi:hypothetical protein